MSTPNKQLIAAIQRIAEGSPLFTEVRGLLKEIQRRGGIEGLSLKIGADDESGGDCCTDPREDGSPEGSPEEKPSWQPPGSDPDTEWNNCETGQPISFDPAGFPQAETCKECEPDETWQEGRFYYVDSIAFAASTISPAAEAFISAAYPYDVACPGFQCRTVYADGWSPSYGPTGLFNGIIVETREVWTNYPVSYVALLHTGGESDCIASQYVSGICTTEPPEKCGDNWAQDNTTNYTLVNGCVVASSCDTDASEQAKQCNACINMCDSDGNQWTVCATGEGGFVAYDPSGEKDGVKYNSNGQQQSVIPAGSGAGGFI